ncbi:MAG: TonB-dependent receptor [Bryobacteraceae bacterium]|nr:TonB-dependent receptor [Bryobacterales bacterium]MEB2360756.1 TonB-dependent receptor [Bryobacterales bacterium]NUN01061.1 TonB-dependent receptor [Bryobacteraceae bacterium]
MSTLKKALTALLMFLAATFTHAQSTDATILGVVRDPSGAVISGVEVIATNVRTNVAKRVFSNDSGNYEIPALPPSEYRLEAISKGFKKQVLTGIILQVNQAARFDIVMQLGDVVEAVTVEATALLIQTDTGAVGQVIDNRKIVDLPLNGRNFTQLATLTPGVTPSGAMGTGRAQSVFVSGSRATKTEFVLDGVSSTGPINGGTGILPSIDALEEFKVQTSAFAAEFGRSPALVNISIKSGSNAFHGSAFEFVRNDVFDARNTFALSKPPLKRNQFGVTFGGPLKQNDFFFFGNYEGLRQRRGTTFNAVVPAAAQKNGDFGSIAIFDPATTRLEGSTYVRSPFPGHRIPADRVAPEAAYFLKFFPEGNNPDGTRYIVSPSNSDDNDQFTIRLDKKVKSAGLLFGRYTFSNVKTFTPSAFPALVGVTLRSRFQNAGVTYTHTWRPTLISETRLGYNREYTLEDAPGIGTNHTVLSGITGFDRTSESVPRFPQIGISGFTGIDGRTFRPLNNTNDIYQIIQTVSRYTGKHTLKVGADLRQQRNTNWNTAYNSGNFSFSGTYTLNPGVARSGSGFADFLLGLPASANRSFPRDAFGNRFSNYHFFAQDDWRATQNLTINLGLRYEFNPWPLGYRNQLTLFDRRLGKVIISDPINFEAQKITRAAYDAMPDAYVTTKELGLPRQIQSNDLNNFAPRAGFAWRVFGDNRTVLRGGYGVFYELVNGNGRTGGVINPPFLFDEVANNNNPIPNRTLHDFFFTQPPSAASPPIIDSRQLNQRTPYEQTWNLMIQRELVANIALEVGYLGKKGTHLERDVLFNQPEFPGPGSIQSRRPFPRFGSGTLRDDGSNSTYHGLQTKLERRFSNGLSFLAAYTWAKSMDDVSTDLGGAVQNWKDYRAEHAVSDFDVAHNFVFSGLYELPFGPGRLLASGAGGVLSRLIGGWQLGAIVQQRSGLPFTPRISIDQANTGTPQRPNRNGPGTAGQRTTAKWFNPADFTIPAQYTFGNSGRNILRADRYNNIDLVLLKNTAITERVSAQLRFEFFNAFNHANYGAPNALVNTATAGQVASANDPRILQFGLKAVF